MQQKILISFPSRLDVEMFRGALERKGFEVIAAYSVSETLNRLQDKVFHGWVLDQKFVAEKGQFLIRHLRKLDERVPGVVLYREPPSQQEELETAPLGLRWTHRGKQLSSLLQDIGLLLPQPPGAGAGLPVDAPVLLGESSAMRHLRETLLKVAGTDATVLLRGETGTGKELAARFLHAHSPRVRQGFLAVNCAALAETLLESELFGHEKGAFTGAHRQKLGKFEFAGRGTLFLDEIGEIPLHLQAKMLRILDDRVFERVGGNRPIPVQCRIIAASNIDFERALREKRFREDLYYRLNVVSIDLPPLRERPEDISLLAHHFLRLKSAKYGKGVSSFAPEALSRLEEAPWPGNARELENAVEKAVILTHGTRLEAVLPPSTRPLHGEKFIGRENDISFLSPAQAAFSSDGNDLPPLKSFQEKVLEASEAEYFDRLLRLHRGHITRAARAAGIDRKTLYRRARMCGLDLGGYKKRRTPP